MEMSHVADDYPAIARRLKELSEESRRAEESALAPRRRGTGGHTTERAPRPTDETYPSHRG